MVRRWLTAVAILLVVAAYMPLRVFLLNIDKFPHPERIALIALVYFLIGFCWMAVLRLVGVKPDAALVSAGTLVFVIGAGGGLVAATTTLVGLGVTVGIAIAFALLLNRMDDDLARILALAASAFLIVGLIVAWTQESLGHSEVSAVEESASSLPPALVTHPDIYIVVLDGFPGSQAIDTVYESNLELPPLPGVNRLEGWTSYPMTIASIASFFEMGHPLHGGDLIDEETARHLAEIMAGDNRFSDVLDRNGYHITHVESGYSYSFCGDVVDRCIGSSFLDEGTFWILDRSILSAELRKTAGSAFTQGSIHTMDWMRESLPLLASNDQADFVFASVLSPHPPLMLDRGCELIYEYWRAGNSVYAGSELVEDRQEAFIDQAACIADFESELFSVVPENAVLLFLSDHGGDSLGQMVEEGRIWSHDDITERMSVHLAMRSPAKCDLENEVFLSEILRDLLWCHSGFEPPEPDPPVKMYTASRIADSKHYKLDEVSTHQMEVVGATDH